MLGLDNFAQGYVECALWADLRDDAGEPLDHIGIVDLPAATLQRLNLDACRFQALTRPILDVANERGRSDEYLGHDFWLTRNGHGTGFWDRDLGATGAALTEAAELFGECDLYTGDDGMVYVTGGT